jgi:hypothetical protein
MVNLYFVNFQSTTYYHLQAYVCLEEWTSGTWKSKLLEVIDMERKYNNILASMIMAENNPYASPIPKAMFWSWWDYALWVGSLYPFFYSDISSISIGLKFQQCKIHLKKHMGLKVHEAS